MQTFKDILELELQLQEHIEVPTGYKINDSIGLLHDQSKSNFKYRLTDRETKSII